MMKNTSESTIESSPEGEELILAGMKMMGVVLHKAHVLVHLSKGELQDLASEVGGAEMGAFAEDLRAVRRTLRDLCAIVKVAERRATAAKPGRAPHVRH
jgi:hypothetical protein